MIFLKIVRQSAGFNYFQIRRFMELTLKNSLFFCLLRKNSKQEQRLESKIYIKDNKNKF